MVVLSLQRTNGRGLTPTGELMLRRLIQIHTVLLIGASALLLIMPGPALDALGIASASFPVLALTRVIAALLAIVAAAVYPIADVAPAARRPALLGVAAAYVVTTLLLGIQQTAIWESTMGAVVVIIAAGFACAFALAVRAEPQRGIAIA